MLGEEPSRTHHRYFSETTLLSRFREFLALICLALRTLATSHLVGSAYPSSTRLTYTRSPVSPPLDEPTTRRGHLTHSNFPRLLPLPYQGVQSFHPLEDAQADCRLPPRYVEQTCHSCLSFANPFKVLRRARPETEEKERKTASGRTFRVQA